MSTTDKQAAGYKSSSVKLLFLSIAIATIICGAVAFLAPGTAQQIALFVWMIAVAVFTIIFQ